MVNVQMNDGGDLGNSSTGAVYILLGKLEATSTENAKQYAAQSLHIERVLELMSNIKEGNAAYHARIDTVINQLVADTSDHEERINDLERAQHQRAGASKVGAAIGHGASAAGGGFLVWALQNLQRAFGH
jgi:hypothetical protein